MLETLRKRRFVTAYPDGGLVVSICDKDMYAWELVGDTDRFPYSGVIPAGRKYAGDPLSVSVPCPAVRPAHDFPACVDAVRLPVRLLRGKVTFTVSGGKVLVGGQTFRRVCFSKAGDFSVTVDFKTLLNGVDGDVQVMLSPSSVEFTLSKFGQTVHFILRGKGTKPFRYGVKEP